MKGFSEFSMSISEKNPHSTPIVKGTHKLAQTRIFAVESVDLEFSNGTERTYERLVSGGHGAVMIVPFKNEDTVYLIREYAVGAEDYTITLPGGAVDLGEAPEEAANRELKEEIGYGAHSIEAMKALSLNPRYAKSTLQTLVAYDLYSEKLEGDEPEELEIIEWNINNLDELMLHPQMVEGRAIAALYLAKSWNEKRITKAPGISN